MARGRPREGNEGLENRYHEVVKFAFFEKYEEGATDLIVTKADLLRAPAAKGFEDLVNAGDAIYDARIRSGLHADVNEKAPPGTVWVILGAGRGKYRFMALDPALAQIRPAGGKERIKIPDATPEIIGKYALDDEQALLARLRYNRLIDIFLGITCYSLQSHLRTHIEDIGQIEVDELYVGVNARGAQFIVPVEAKAAKDPISVVQAWQGFGLCAKKFPSLIPRPVAATFIGGDRQSIAVFEFAPSKPVPLVREERHFQLVPASQISAAQLEAYRGAEAATAAGG